MSGVNKIRSGSIWEAVEYYTGGGHSYPNNAAWNAFNALLQENGFTGYEYLYFFMHQYTHKVRVTGPRSGLLLRANQIRQESTWKAFLDWKKNRRASLMEIVHYQLQSLDNHLMQGREPSELLLNKQLQVNSLIRLEKALKSFPSLVQGITDAMGMHAWTLLKGSPEYLDYLPLLRSDIEGEGNVFSRIHP